MGRPLRHIEENRAYFITSRCFQCRCLLAPKKEVVELCAGWLARAVARFEVRLFAATFMGNHFHLEAAFPEGNMPAFMQYFKGQLAQAVNRFWGRTGAVFERRYSAEPIMDDAAVVDRWLYTMANPPAAGLVATCADWPGFSTLNASLGDGSTNCPLVDRTAYHRALQHTQPSGAPSLDEFSESHLLEVERLPGFEHLSDEDYRAHLAALINERDREIAASRLSEGFRVLPRRKLESTRHSDRPREPARSVRPLCHASSLAARRAYGVTYRALVDAYRPISAAFRAGELTMRFPAGTFPPPIITRIRPPPVHAASNVALQHQAAS